MKRIPLTNCQEYTLVDDGDFEYLNRWKWHKSSMGYAKRHTTISGVEKTIYMHRELTKPDAGYEVDHINRNKLDNRRPNLRQVTRRENMINRAPWGKSKYKGVKWDKQKNRWIAFINWKGRCLKLGTYRDEKLAAVASNAAMQKYHGELAVLNAV